MQTGMNRNEAFQALTEFRYGEGKDEALFRKTDAGFVIAQTKALGKWDGVGDFGRAFTLTWTGRTDQGVDQYSLDVEPDAKR